MLHYDYACFRTVLCICLVCISSFSVDSETRLIEILEYSCQDGTKEVGSCCYLPLYAMIMVLLCFVDLIDRLLLKWN